MSLISYNGKPTVHNGKIIGPPTLIIADEPTITGDLTYNGSVQSPTFNYNIAAMSLSGTTSATNAGTYEATFTLRAGYKWADGSAGVKTVSWNIGKANCVLYVKNSSITIDADKTAIQVVILGEGRVGPFTNNFIVNTSNAFIATAEAINLQAPIISIAKKGAGSCTITVQQKETKNYLASNVVSIAVICKIAVTPPTLADASSWYKGATDKSTLLGIEFQDSYDPTGATIIESWNGDINGNGSIKCYINGSGILIIAGNGFGKIIANENSSSLFDDFQNILTIVNLPLLDTSNVNTMSNMFYNCINLQELDLSNFDTSQVLNMNYMFSECKSLQSLDLSTFDFSLVETTSAMFRNCVLLSTIGFNYSKTNGDQMLNCTDMSYMFADCESLPLLDFSFFNTEQVKSMKGLFGGCTNLEAIWVGGYWTTVSVSDNGENMFYNCSSLVGAISYDPTQTDISMATYDTGYLTVSPRWV